MIARFLRYTNRRLQAIFAAVAVGVLVLGWNVLIREDLKKLGGLRVDRHNQTIRANVLKQILNAERDIAGYRNRLAASNEMSWLMNTVGKVAEDGSFPLRSVDPQNPVRENGAYDKILLQIRTQCTYHELGEFVSRIESYSKLLRVISVSLSPAGPDDGTRSPQLDVDMQIATYYAVGKDAPA